MAKVKDELMDHNYDGIQEYDNPMPGWWVYLFIITVIWSVGYMYYYHVSGNWSGQHGEWAADIKANQKPAAMSSLANFKFTLTEDGNALASGKDIFIKNCASCHGPEGQGSIGPNLTDNTWIHGGQFENIVTTILEGVPAKSMIAWKTILKPEQVQQVASFVWTLYGTNPPNPKQAEGEPFERN